MRRQVWKSKDGDWIKHEFKLLEREVITDISGKVLRENVGAMSYPVLVHYFQKKKKTPVRNAKKKEKPSGTSKKKAPIENPHITEIPQYLPVTPASPPSPPSPVLQLTPGPHVLDIVSYSPTFGFSLEKNILLFVTPDVELTYKYTLKSGDSVICTATIIGNTMLQVKLPPHQPGFISFYLVGQNSSYEIMQVSQEIIFSFIPSDPQGALQVYGILQLSPFLVNQFPLFRHTVRILDLSDNALEHVDFLKDFELLEVLILIRNRLHSNSIFPYLPRLSSLSVSHNEISDISELITNLKPNMPKLIKLNTLENPCSTGFTTPHQYLDYRKFVFGMLPNLIFLDNSIISESERFGE
eukprot:TRINITY_DN1032_c0_g1_i3.p1 TRINITY_DN1032_c0_g1~~TRINITY_DN1032_c0_g1_i3.p1  ORF type:complete len:354 (+),score=61.63 TRINITY_DN1032_c0_g1_i3:343-1404(+)